MAVEELGVVWPALVCPSISRDGVRPIAALLCEPSFIFRAHGVGEDVTGSQGQGFREILDAAGVLDRVQEGVPRLGRFGASRDGLLEEPQPFVGFAFSHQGLPQRHQRDRVMGILLDDGLERGDDPRRGRAVDINADQLDEHQAFVGFRGMRFPKAKGQRPTVLHAIQRFVKPEQTPTGLRRLVERQGLLPGGFRVGKTLQSIAKLAFKKTGPGAVRSGPRSGAVARASGRLGGSARRRSDRLAAPHDRREQQVALGVGRPAREKGP